MVTHAAGSPSRLLLPIRVRTWAEPTGAAAAVAALTVTGHAPLLRAEPSFVLVIAVVCAAFTATGTVLLRTRVRPSAGVGFLAAGVLFAFAGVDAWPGFGPALAFLFAGPFLVPLGWGTFHYLDDELSRPQRRWTVWACVLIFGGTVAQTVLSRPEWNKYPSSAWWPTLYADRSTYDVLTTVLGAGWLALGITYSALLFRRYREANFFERLEVLAITIGGALLATCSVVVFLLFFLLPPWFSWRDAYGVLGLLMSFIIISFLVSLGARLSLQTRLLAELPRLSTPRAVTSYLRSALNDDELHLRFYDRTTQEFLVPAGQVAPGADVRLDRHVVVNGGDEPVAELSAAAATIATWRNLPGFQLVALNAIENARLQAVLSARAAELGESRRELVEQRQGAAQLQRDLHDTVQQTLYAARLDAINLERELGHRPESVVDKVERAIGQVRTIARGSVPLARSASVETSFVTVADELGLDASIVVQSIPLPGLEADIIAIGSEALTNVHKHASAAEVLLRVFTAEGELRLEVMDNGVGGADHATRTSGIDGIRERVRIRGGRFQIQSRRGIGTKVIATWPLL